MRGAVAMAWLAAACGGSAEPAQHAALPAIALDATPAAPDDAVVARVDGHPVYASCVAAQAAHDHVDARAALRECIDFELLARAAAARGLTDDPDVRDALRGALANRAVELGFEDHTFTTADFGATWDKVVKRLGYLYDHVEYRASFYVRVPLDAGAPPDADAAAHAVADRIAAAVAGQTGLFSVDLLDVATPIAAAAHVPLEHAEVGGRPQRWFDKPYGEALYALPEVGRASAAVRSRYGWDVILATQIIPEVHEGHDAMVAGLIPEARKAYFTHWVDGLAVAMRLGVEKHPELIPDDEADSGSGSGGSAR
jgi:hypothetical protein